VSTRNFFPRALLENFREVIRMLEERRFPVDETVTPLFTTLTLCIRARLESGRTDSD
jgi:hypothetical protein